MRRSLSASAVSSFPRTLPCLLGLIFLVASGCASAGRMAPDAEPERTYAPPPAAIPSVTTADTPPVHEDAIEHLLRSEVRTWEGTPHVMGGTDRGGADCSGFVMKVYDSVFDLSVPRTTADQVQFGRPVTADALRAGDLVFFQPSEKTRHVGIYLRNGEFAHVSSSRGVTVSHLGEPYWKEAYWTSRRILGDAPTPDSFRLTETMRPVAPPAPAAAPAVPEARADAQAEPSTTPRRVGW